MKKFYIFFLILSVLSVCSQAQILFKVISVNGEIVATKSNTTLQNGLEVKSDESFRFIKPESRAALINPEQGRILLTQQNAATAFGRAAFAPAMSGISTRSGMLLNALDLTNYFGKPVVMIGKMELKISPETFPMSDNSMFFIRYLYKGEEINKRLSFRNDTLIIDRTDLYTVDGKPIPNPDVPDMSLFYIVMDGSISTVRLISKFTPVFIPEEQIKSEIGIIIDSMKGKAYDAVFAEIYDYICGFYGIIDVPYLTDWLNREFKLSK